jgi:hypothetical protein
VAPSALPSATSWPTPAAAAADRATGTSAGTVTRTEAPASASWVVSSRSVAAGVTPVTVPPAAIAPRATPAHWGRLGAHRASTSPGANPRAASPAATPRIRWASSR